MRHCRLLSLILALLLHAAVGARAATPIPFQFRDGMIWLKIIVDGKSEPLNFLLDSGAGASVLDLRTARRLGMPLGQQQTVQGVHHRTVAYRVEGFVARAAGVTVPSALLALDLSGPSARCHQRIDGLLGADFFRRRIVQIDFARQVVRLLEPGEVDTAGCEILPLVARNDAFCTRISVDGEAPDWLRVDTGCNSALEWVVSGRKAAQRRGTTMGVNHGDAREAQTDVQLGTKYIPAVKTGLHTRQIFAGEAGLIGNGLLSRFTITLDPAGRRCLLSSR